MKKRSHNSLLKIVSFTLLALICYISVAGAEVASETHLPVTTTGVSETPRAYDNFGGKNFTCLDDGKTLVTNNSYWILWDRISPHYVGDTFYINATTNLSVGTVLKYEFYDATPRNTPKHPIDSELSYLISGETRVKPGNGLNNSITIYTTIPDNPKGWIYDLNYYTISSESSAQVDAFNKTQTSGLCVLHLVIDDNSTSISPYATFTPSPPLPVYIIWKDNAHLTTLQLVIIDLIVIVAILVAVYLIQSYFRRYLKNTKTPEEVKRR